MDFGRREISALAALVAVAALLRLYFAWRYPGFLGGDDFEIVASAARYALGLPDRPFAIRSELHPLLAAIPVRAGALAGWRSPRAIAFLASLPTVAASTLAIALVFRIARRLGLAPRAALAAAFLLAFHPLMLAFGGTQYPRPISACLLLAAFLTVLRPDPSIRRLAGAGAIAAAAFAVRWSEGAALVPLAGAVFFTASTGRERASRVGALLGGFAATGLVVAGALDAATWGRPFASLEAMSRLAHDPNLGGFPSRPPLWYAGMAGQWIGPVLLLLLLAGWRDPRARPTLSIAASFVLLLSFSPIKELRYTQFAVAWLCVAGALGWERLRAGERAARTLGTAALLLAAPYGLERATHVLSRKSQAAVAAAAYLSETASRPRIVLLEQAWAYGDRLYLGAATEVRDLAPRRPLPLEAIRRAAEGADAACLYADDADAAVEAELERRGLQRAMEIRRGPSRPVVVYRRGDPVRSR